MRSAFIAARLGRRLLLPRALEHLEHTLRDRVAAHGVGGAEQLGEEADDALRRRVGAAQRHHGTDHDDAVHEVGAAHQRCVQDHGYLRDDLVAGEGREKEDVDRGEALDHGAPPSTSVRTASFTIAPSRVSTLPLRISSSQSSARSPSLMNGVRKCMRLRAYWSEACTGSMPGMLSGP